jgi:3-phenylpropionate/trans-cinnamate dioxygenase ferredoxin reductase subunit
MKADSLVKNGHIVVVGAGHAGQRAAKSLRARGFAGCLTVIERESALPCDRPPLSKEVLSSGLSPWEGQAGEQELRALNISLILGDEVTRVDLERRIVNCAGGSTLSYDGLILASGARPRRPPVLSGLSRVHVLRTAADALDLRAELRTADRVAVVGAGVLGLEIASSARTLGVEVTMIEAAEVPMLRVLGQDLGRLIEPLLRIHGVELLCGRSVIRASTGAEDRCDLELSDGSRLTADVVAVAIGADPDVGWLRGTELDLDEGIRCDEFCSAAPRVYAAGDVARWDHRTEGEAIRAEHWTNAGEQGELVAENLMWELEGLPGKRRPYAPLGYVWSDHFGARLQVVGRVLPGDEAIVLDAAEAGASFIAMYTRKGRVVALAGRGEARRVAAGRRQLVSGCTAEELARTVAVSGDRASIAYL